MKKMFYLIYFGTKQGEELSNDNLILFLLEQPKAYSNPKLSQSELNAYTNLFDVIKKDKALQSGILGNIVSPLESVIGKVGDSLLA